MVRQLSPTVSLVHPRPAAPYGGPLKLTAARLPPAPAVLQAHQLAPPLDVVPLGRILLGIRSRARHLMTAAGRWIAAVDGEDSPREHLHSLAVSLTSGEVIYHDRRNLDLPHAHAPVGRATAVAVARAWLTKLGWPGARMPLAAVDRAPGMARVRAVKFGWPGVGAAGVDAATLWVTPNRSVIEAWLWPPVMRHGAVSALPLSAAWDAVRSGRAPIAVPGAPARARAPGSGSLLHAGVIAILSVRRSGRVFLVPAYRFEGQVHIAGASTHTWFSLAPGARSTR
jgi:hypothetical protein